MAVRNCAEIGENLQKILKYLIADEKLGKLLYYTDKDPLNESHTAPSKEDLYEKLIRITPKVTEDDKGRSFIIMKVDNGSVLPSNGEFRIINLSIEVFVPLTQWFIKDINLRPFAILGRVQELLDGLTINGVGKLSGGDFEINLLDKEVCSYIALYQMITYD